MENRLKRFFSRKMWKGIDVDENVKRQIEKIFKHFDEYGESRIRKQATFKMLPEMVRCGVKHGYLKRFLLVSGSLAMTKRKMVLYYGKKEGIRRWNRYIEKQSYTNTLEYKKEKYGMTEEEFHEYNSSRAVTLENMIKRHGDEEGARRWNVYVERQRYAGVKKEYFIEKYGEDTGEKKYKEMNRLKSNTMDAFVSRHGKEEGERLYFDYIDKRASSQGVMFSNISQDLFDEFDKNLPGAITYYGRKNKEFHRYDTNSKASFLYDFVALGCDSVKKPFCIEFNGDFWHANPKIYPEGWVNSATGMSAKEIWEKDSYKNNFLRNQGFIVLVVWENDLRTNGIEYTINDILDKLGECGAI